MVDRWVGLVASSDRVVAVDASVPDSGPLTIEADHSWSMQKGARPEAYRILHQHISDYLVENQIARVVVKESAVGQSGSKLAHLHAAELRGVALCACATANVETVTLSKAVISKRFGARKVDEYLK